MSERTFTESEIRDRIAMAKSAATSIQSGACQNFMINVINSLERYIFSDGENDAHAECMLHLIAMMEAKGA